MPPLGVGGGPRRSGPPVRMSVIVHPAAKVQVGKLSKFAPGIRVGPGDPDCLAFIDADGESHVFVLGDEGRRGLASQLSGVILQ